MTLPEMLSTLRAHEARTGAVVVPEWLRRYGDEWCYEDYTRELDDDAAALILIGCMARWLGEQGVAVSFAGGWWQHEPCYMDGVYYGIRHKELDATTCLEANYAATIARLGGREKA